MHFLSCDLVEVIFYIRFKLSEQLTRPDIYVTIYYSYYFSYS